MTVYAWPNKRVFVPATATLLATDNSRMSESPLSGYIQTSSVPGARWGWAFDWPAMSDAERDEVEAFLLRLSGHEHRVTLPDSKRRRPRGTINLTGVTASAASQFATSITLNDCGAGKTLLVGDWFSVAIAGGLTQLVRCVLDATANGSGVMVVEFRHMLRGAVAGSAAVVLDAPTALYVRRSPELALPRQPGRAAPPLSCEFVEVFV
jgi:hypothetical protein